MHIEKKKFPVEIEKNRLSPKKFIFVFLPDFAHIVSYVSNLPGNVRKCIRKT